MKLMAFRVQNYRSIIDTDWQRLSSDNLTTIVGQNESGKSALLDALLAFYIPNIEDDSLRNDGSFPVVSCRFKTTKAEIKEIIGENDPPKGIYAILEKSNYEIDAVRSWTSLENDTTLTIDNGELSELILKQDEDAQSAYQKLLEARTLGAEEDSTTDDLVESTLAETPVSPAIASIIETPADVSTSAHDDDADEIDLAPILEPNTIAWTQFVERAKARFPEFVKFVDEASFLPETIDLDDVIKNNPKAKGILGTKNFLDIAGLTTEDILIDSHRRSGSKIRTASKRITADFRTFWRQVIGGNGAKAEIEVELKHYPSNYSKKTYIGKPYLVFWVKNGDELLHPHQRSRGLQWFLSFFLQLRAADVNDSRNQVLLMDEPGHYLHIEAQKDVLEVFEKSKKCTQIIYTTHSPNLIKLNGLHRILAVQRSDDGDSGETQVISARKLVSAKTDTLLPILAVIGADISTQNVIERANNVILEEISAFYYLSSFKKLLGNGKAVHFLPANGAANVRTYVQLFLGWGIDFLVVLDDDRMGREQLKLIRDDVYGEDSDESKRHLMSLTGFNGIEDVFTKGNFRTHVLKEPSTKYKDKDETNSGYVKRLGLSKPLLAIDFYHRVNDDQISLADFDVTTQSNIKNIIDEITNKLGEIEAYSGSSIES